MSRYLELIEQGHNPADLYNSTTLVVTFIDGVVKRYPDVRYLAAHPSMGLPDPIVVRGTTVEFEDMERSTTLLGVRSFQMEF